MTAMPFDTNQTVRDLALKVPGATRVFEKLHIDYCCGGMKSFAEACSAAGLSAERVATALADASGAADAGTPDSWEGEPLSALIDHILQKHHAYTREELERLGKLSTKVATVHGARHAEVTTVRRIVAALDADLQPHLLKEEHILFPFIIELERSARTGRGRPASPFGTIENPVQMMLAEHDAVGDLLRELREVTRDYALPEDACMSYRTLYSTLGDMEKDLHQHIHLENNVLFPRALALET